MNIELYELEHKLGISDMEKCTLSDTDAIKTVLSQGKPLPEGIMRDKKGNYYKFIGNPMTDEEKKMYVEYKKLVCEIWIKRGVYACAVLLAAIFVMLVLGVVR